MTIEEQLDRLNRTTWIVMTEPDVNKKWFNINITNILNDLYKDGYLICVGDKEHSYSIGELRAIDRLVVWITQISYAQNEIEDQIAMYEDDAETDKFDDMIEEAPGRPNSLPKTASRCNRLLYKYGLEQNNT